MIRVCIGNEDGGYVTLRASGAYNPDILEDLCNRAAQLYGQLHTPVVEPVSSDEPQT